MSATNSQGFSPCGPDTVENEDDITPVFGMLLDSSMLQELYQQELIQIQQQAQQVQVLMVISDTLKLVVFLKIVLITDVLVNLQVNQHQAYKN